MMSVPRVHKVDNVPWPCEHRRWASGVLCSLTIHSQILKLYTSAYAFIIYYIDTFINIKIYA